MGELRGNVSVDISMKYTATGLGSQTWQGNFNHARSLTPGSGLGKVNQGCEFSASAGLLPTVINLKTLCALAAEPDKAVQSDGDIAMLNFILIKNLSPTANLTIGPANVNGAEGIAGAFGPEGVLFLDFGKGGRMLGTNTDIQLTSTGAGTPVLITVAGC